MATGVLTAYPISEWAYINGNRAQGVHPETLDKASTHLIAGYGFHYGVLVVANAFGVTGAGQVLRLPILLPPWCGGVSAAVKAALEFETDFIKLTLIEWDAIAGETNIGLSTVTLGVEEFGIYGPAVTTWTEWGGIPWAGAGSIGGNPASGKGLVECAPVNAWRTCYLDATVPMASGQIHGLGARPVVSATPVPVGG